MKLKELDRLNHEEGFNKYRQKLHFPLLISISFAGSLIILLWSVFDRYYLFGSRTELFWLRGITIGVFMVNLLLAYLLQGKYSIKQPIIAGFYFGAVFCMLLSMLTGASQSPYWYGLFFVLAAWFVLFPFSYRELIIHGAVFIVIFITGQYAQKEVPILNHEMGKIIFFYGVTFLVGSVAAIVKNRLDAINYLAENELDQINTHLRKFRSILDQAPGAVMIMDKEYRFEYINPHFTKISGYTEEDLLRKNIGETLYSGNIPESRKGIVESITSGKPWQGELLTRNKNGSMYWANTIAAPFMDKNGQVDGYVVMQQDITEKKQMESLLAEQESLYRSLIEKSLDGVVISQDGKVILVNKAFADMMGYTIEECLANFGPNSIADEDRERVIDIHYRRMKGELGDMRYNAAMICKDGSKVIAEFNTTTIEYNGKPASLITTRDITHQLKMQEALRESEMKYKTLVDNSQDGIMIVRNNQILFANDTFCRMMKYSADELMASPSVRFIHPDDRERALQISARRQQGDSSTIIENFRLLMNGGEVLECETYSTFIEYEGKMSSFFTIHDITERKRMQEALKESEQKYRTLIEKAVDGIIITQQGRLVFVNKSFCEMMQYNEGELINHPYLDFVVTEDHEMMKAYHTRRMQGEDFQTIYRSTIIRKDGSQMHVELNTRTSEYNNNPAAFIIVRDITDRLKTEEELRRAKEELEMLNRSLEIRVNESTVKLTEVNTQLIRLQKENLQSQFEVLRQQVNPHFLFNSLNVLTSLIKIEPDLAEKFTEHLSKVYRYVLENKDNDLVSLQTELDFLDAYLFLLNIRFMDKIRVAVNIRESMREYQVLPLALQLIIENAIKHNTMSKKAPLTIHLFIDDELRLNIVNNLQERESQMISTGVGLRNIAHRYELLGLPVPEFFKTSDSFVARIPLKLKENT